MTEDGMRRVEGGDSAHLDSILRLAHVGRRLRSSVNWARIENDLGRALPIDFKELSEVVPGGQFGHLLVRTPALYGRIEDFLHYFVETVGEVEESLEGLYDVPFGFYPEPGGFLSWANVEIDTFIGWIGDSSNENRSVCIVNTSGDWEIFEGTTTEFLEAVIAGNYQPEILGALKVDSFPLRFYPYDVIW